ncbi:hypothetical protein C0991_006186 [Blastosporella zonata]|nr:hypothetical protein C0991_006186 [Blastosporella zonata]
MNAKSEITDWLTDISTSYVDHLHAKPSEPPSPSVSPGSFTPPKTPAQRVPAEPILIPAGPSAETALATSCTSPNCTSRSSTERTPLLQSPKVRPTSEPVRKPKRSQSLYNLNDDSLLDLILLNAPRLSRGTLPHSGLAGWGHEVACVCHMRVVPSQTHPGDVDEEEQEGREDILGMVGRQRQVVGILVRITNNMPSILQLGIMIHSFVIGLTLAIATGTDFTSLVTAIVFHQLFEGLSLGIRIAGLPSSPRPNRRWLAPTLSILFAITTPLGMGSGALAFTSARKGEAVQMRLTQGLMSGISAGMLIYAATVEMLAGDFVFGDVGGDHGHGHGHGHSGLDEVHEHDESAVQVRRKVLAVCSLLAGAAAMAFVGECHCDPFATLLRGMRSLCS